jgi:hypothetical protein
MNVVVVILSADVRVGSDQIGGCTVARLLVWSSYTS